MSAHHNVLIIEDSVELATMIMVTLGRIGLRTRHASEGKEAVALAKAERPDLIILDLNLPGMGGWETLEEIHAHYDSHPIPTIVTTAHNDPSNRVIGKLQSVHRYITKPFLPRDMIEAIQAALALS